MSNTFTAFFFLHLCYVPPLPVVALFPLLMYGCSAVCFSFVIVWRCDQVTGGRRDTL